MDNLKRRSLYCYSRKKKITKPMCFLFCFFAKNVNLLKRAIHSSIYESLIIDMVMDGSDLGFLLFSSLAFSPLKLLFFPQTLIFPAVFFDSLCIGLNL